MSYALFADVVSLILIFAGALLVLSAAIGVARFQDPMSRIHFVTKPQTVGLIFTILGAGIRVTGSESFGVAERGVLGIFILAGCLRFGYQPGHGPAHDTYFAPRGPLC